MESLKKTIAIVMLLVVCGVSASAQVSPSKIFENNYAKEASGDYQGAINDLVGFHKKNGKYATLTAVQPSGKFGVLEIDQKNDVHSFQEKPKGDGAWINGGFFVLEPQIFNYIKQGDETVWEREPLENLAKDNQLSAFKHEGFWHPMDTLRDKNELEKLWASPNAPWKSWHD